MSAGDEELLTTQSSNGNVNTSTSTSKETKECKLEEPIEDSESSLEEEEEEDYESKKNWMEFHQSCINAMNTKPKLIKLNVGGMFYTTSLSTLTSTRTSMLSAMFSGRYSPHQDDDGSYFIDR